LTHEKTKVYDTQVNEEHAGTDFESLASEYVRSKRVADDMAKRSKEIRDVLARALNSRGEEDDRGNLWMGAGRYLLRYQKRQSSPTLNKDAAESWAKENGLWEDLKKVTVVEEVDEDALVSYVFKNPEYEDDLRTLYTVPEPTWAFMMPEEVDQYDDL
jgi:hypothetical protein